MGAACLFTPHCLALPPPATGDHAAAPLRCEVEQPLLFSLLKGSPIDEHKDKGRCD